MKQFLFVNIDKPQRILLGQLASYGDCLYATAVARQIKFDYPHCHLTWAIGSMYSSIIDQNPYVDSIWKIPLSSRHDIADVWNKFEQQAKERKKRGEFDLIFFTQIYPNNYQNFDGTIRSSIFRGYKKKITVPVNPVLRLLDWEVDKVRTFVERNNLINTKHLILFECSSKSDQSFVTPEFAIEVSKKIFSKIDNIKVILSSNIPVFSDEEYIVDASSLSFRENAELTKYCSLLIGCSSGISWLSTSDWAKQLPMIQLLKADKSVYASFIHDHKYHKLSTDFIIEMTDVPADKVVRCVLSIFTEGFSNAKLKFNENIPLKFDFYLKTISYFLDNKQYYKITISLFNTLKRYGINYQLVKELFVKTYNKYILKKQFS